MAVYNLFIQSEPAPRVCHDSLLGRSAGTRSSRTPSTRWASDFLTARPGGCTYHSRAEERAGPRDNPSAFSLHGRFDSFPSHESPDLLSLLPLPSEL
jgi:hypothetical protein